MRKSKRENFGDDGFEAWGGYMNAKIAKLEEQFLEQVEKEQSRTSSIFSGISIFVNGYTKPSSDELKMLMAEHGGIYHHYFKSDRTKFIIASNLPDTKVKNLPTTKIIKPEWISESIKAGKLLDHKEFLLYSNHSKTQPRLKFQSVDNTTKQASSNLDDTEQANDLTKNIEDIIINKITPETSSSCTENNFNTSKKSEPDNFHTKNNISSDVVSSSSDIHKRSTRTAVDPKFLSEYYSNSRLHHISQLGAGFKQYVNELRDTSDFSFPAREILKSASNREENCSTNVNKGKVVMHIDMDCFFVSVGLRKNPHFRGKPVAVAHSKGAGGKQNKREGVDRQAELNLYKAKKKNNIKKNLGNDYIEELEKKFPTRLDGLTDDEKYGSMSEIASCSYEARALGVHNGMFMGPALRLCPDLKTIPYDFEAYKEVAYILYNTVAQYTLDIEAVSCDEMYVECTDLLNNVNLQPMEFARVIRDEIKRKTGCPCSTGFGSNRLQARLATKKAKPDGQFHLSQKDVQSYFSDISLGDLPGVGRQMAYKLTSLGYTNCASLRSTDLSTLQKHFGNKTGLLLYNYCRGQDDKPLNFTILRKSISAGVNYGIRFEDFSQCENFLKQLCQEVCLRMSQNKIIGKSLTFKLMVRAANAPVETAKFMGHGFCDNITKTTNLSQATDDLNVITKEVIDICKKLNVQPVDMRGVSIQISKLENKSRFEETKGGITNFLQPKKSVAEITRGLISHQNNEPQCNKIEIIQESTPIIIETEKNLSEVSTQETNSLPAHSLIVREQQPYKINMNAKELSTNKKNLPEKKNKSLGLTGKRRGRPPKNASLSNNTHTKERNKTVNLFLPSNSSLINKAREAKEYNFEELDQDCLNALPEDLKSEILANCKVRKQNIKSNVDTPMFVYENNNIDPEYLAALPEEIRKEIETNITQFTKPFVEKKLSVKMDQSECLARKSDEMKTGNDASNPETEQHSEPDIFGMHWKDVREMLRNWFKSTMMPLQCDVDIITVYVKNLVMNKQIEDVDCLLKFCYRSVNENLLCSWHQVYLQIERNVQEAMQLVYKKKLKTSITFTCCAS